MSALVDVKPLRDAMSFAMKAIDTRNTIPILANVMLRTGDAELWIIATDLDIEVRVGIDAVIDAPLVITIDAAELTTFAKRVPTGGQIRISQDGHTTRLSCGRARTTLSALPAEDFPVMRAGEGKATPDSGTIEAADLGTMLSFCAPSVSKEETRYYLCGVYLHTPESAPGVQGRLRAVATDGNILSQIEGPAWQPIDCRGVILPVKACGLLTAMKGGPVELSISETLVTVTRPRLRISTKVVDGTYPDYTRVIPRNEGEITLTVDAVAMIDAAQLALVGVDRMVKDSNAVRLAPGKGAVGIRGGNESQGTETEIDAQESEGSAFGLSAVYMSTILSAYGEGPITIRGHDPGSPFLFTREEDDDRLAVIMPMRV